MRKVLLDAQLPNRLKTLFSEFGFDVLHTLDLPQKNKTTDKELIRLCAEEQRIIITKDTDFVESYLLFRQPKQLLLLSCGNLNNRELEQLFRANLKRIEREFEFNNFLELSRDDIIVHS
jgi:predicted nuclease of predicted toxin-antitoxin system